MDLEAELRTLCAVTPDVIGAVLCDFEGESVAAAMGVAAVPEAAHALAADHVPRTMRLEMPVEAFLLRLGAAELCAFLRSVDASSKTTGGAAVQLHLHYENVSLLVHGLPNEFYLVLVVRRPAPTAVLNRALGRAAARISPEVSW